MPDEYTPRELVEMGEDEAKDTLTVNQYERREELKELYDEAEAEDERMQEEAETVAEVAVVADMESLGTRVDIFGNDLLVHLDMESREFRRRTQRLEKFEEDVEDAGDIDDETLNELGDTLEDLLDMAIAKWGETEWDALDEPERQTLLAEARDKWGVDGMQVALTDIMMAIREDREDKVEEVKSFRGT